MKLRNSKTWTKTTTYNLPKPHAFSQKAPPLSTESRGLFVEYGQNTAKTAAVLPAKAAESRARR